MKKIWKVPKVIKIEVKKNTLGSNKWAAESNSNSNNGDSNWGS